jgi:hypothetical protein
MVPDEGDITMRLELTDVKTIRKDLTYEVISDSNGVQVNLIQDVNIARIRVNVTEEGFKIEAWDTRTNQLLDTFIVEA